MKLKQSRRIPYSEAESMSAWMLNRLFHAGCDGFKVTEWLIGPRDQDKLVEELTKSSNTWLSTEIVAEEGSNKARLKLYFGGIPVDDGIDDMPGYTMMRG